VRAAQSLTGAQTGLNLISVYGTVHFIRKKNVNDVSNLRGLINAHYLKTVLNSGIPALTGTNTDDDVNTTVAHAKSLSTALSTITDNGHSLTIENAYISVLIMKNFHCICNVGIKVTQHAPERARAKIPLFALFARKKIGIT
jgi:hypothetical protein